MITREKKEKERKTSLSLTLNLSRLALAPKDNTRGKYFPSPYQPLPGQRIGKYFLNLLVALSHR